jgi:hypothetical protein
MNVLPLHSAFLNSTSLSHDAAPPLTRSIFPGDAHALIYRPARSPMTSAPSRKQEWKLRFERRSPLRIEPLMGWTEDDDPLAQVELSFPSAKSAIAYARRQGLSYTVLGSPRRDPELRAIPHDPAKRPIDTAAHREATATPPRSQEAA